MARDTTSWIIRAAAVVAAMVLLIAMLAASGLAAEWRGHEVPHWGHGDIRHFHEGDWNQWRAGH
jgi:hypothetical protein